ncbi:retroviral-like aspartic protease family protein [bacterium]|nr:retroviral-like aspartic protease family protein [bacterium]
MGKIIVKVKMWNFQDEEKVRAGKVVPIEVEALVDTGATMTIINAEIAKKLHLMKNGSVSVRYANEKVETKELVIGLRMEIMGRDTVCRAIVDPARTVPLLGQLALEDMDLWVDSKNGKLMPNPESPDAPLMDAL